MKKVIALRIQKNLITHIINNAYFIALKVRYILYRVWKYIS